MDLFKKHLFSEFWITYTHFHYIIISLFFGPGLNEWALCLQAAAKNSSLFFFLPQAEIDALLNLSRLQGDQKTEPTPVKGSR